MNRFTSKKGFSLLETVIAISIAVGVLTAMVATNRLIQNNINSLRERTQMTALAEESIATLRTLRDVGQKASPPTTLAQLAPSFSTASTSDTVINGAFYSEMRLLPLEGFNLKWCLTTNTLCKGTVFTPVIGTGSGCNLRPGDHLGDVFACTNGGEIVAMRRTQPALLQDTRQIVDVSNLVMGGMNVNLSETDKYSFYIRKITVTRQGSDNKDVSNAGNFSNSVYSVDVTITNINNLEETVTKKTLLTDWK